MLIAQLPFIPYVHSGEDVVFFVYLMMRTAGLFMFSPLLSNRNVSTFVRSMLVVFITILLSITIYPDYRGDSPKYILRELNGSEEAYLSLLGITCAKELSIGYLVGFFFSILLEALLFAAQSTSIMIGFATARMIDPISGTSQALLGQLYMIMASLLVVILDLHHIFIRIVADSFDVLPIGSYQINHEALSYITKGSSRLWHYSLQYASIPYTIIFLITVGLGFMAKIMPEMNIFMVGFPLKIFVGYYSLIFAVGYFPLILKKAFIEYENLTRLVLSLLIPTPT